MTQKHANRLALFLLFAPFVLWIGLIVILPHIGMVGISLRERVGFGEYEFSLSNFREFVGEPIYWTTLLRTATIAILVTVLCLIFGFPIAYYIAKVARPGTRAALLLLCLVPLWVSELVRAFGWMLLLRESGVLSLMMWWSGLTSGPVEMLFNDVTLVIGLIYAVILFMIVPLVSTLDGMDDSLVEAGYNLGGSRFTVMRRIVVPYAMPGIVAGSIIVFMFTAGSFLTPVLLGGKESMWFTELLYNQFIVRHNWELGATFGVALLAFTSLTVWTALRLSGHGLTTTMARD